MNPLLIGVAIVALVAGSSLHLPAWMKSQPPTAALVAAQADLAKAQAAQKQAEASQKQAEDALTAAKTQQAAITAQQLDYAQEFASGAGLALAKVPAAAQTPEIKLATDMVTRANAGLEAARGKLPAAAQAEIQQLIDQALSAVTAQRDAYQAALVQKDATLQTTIQAKTALEVKIPVLQAQVTTEQAKTAAAKAETATVASKTDVLQKEITDWAAKKAASDSNGSFWQWVGILCLKIIVALVVLYLLVHGLIPLLAESYPAISWLTTLSLFLGNLTTARTPVVPAASTPAKTA